MKTRKSFVSVLLTVAMLISLAAVMSVGAFADNTAVLDLDSGTESIGDNQTVAQNYDLNEQDGTHTNVTKVNVSWTTTDIAATRTNNKTWDPDSLTWKTTSSSTSITQNGGATFTLTNLSSTKVNAGVTFAQVTGFSDPTLAYTVDSSASSKGESSIGTVVNDDFSVDTDNDHDVVIGVTVTPVANDFATLTAADNVQYGTYTVTISAVS